MCPQSDEREQRAENIVKLACSFSSSPGLSAQGMAPRVVNMALPTLIELINSP